MPLFNYGRVPGQTPSGRGVTYSADEAKAAKILADADRNPNAYSQQQIAWAKSILPDTAPVIQNKRLASAPGIGNPLDAFAFGAQRFGRAPVQSTIDAFNARHGTNITGPQLLNYPRVNASPINSLNSASINNPMDDTARRQAEVDAIAGGMMYRPQVTNPDAIASLFRSQFGAELPMSQMAGPGVGAIDVNTSPFGAMPTGPSATPALNFQSTISPGAKIAGTLGSFGTQWDDKNDPGGFIRKHQSKLASQPWTGNLGNTGQMLGFRGTSFGM